MRPVARPSIDCLDHLVGTARVPVWLPWPLPQGWLVTGFAHAGDDAMDVRWCTTAELADLPLTPSMYDALSALGLAQDHR